MKRSEPPMPEPGQPWRDKDKRAAIRSVRVASVDAEPGGFTYYRRGRFNTSHGQLYRSRNERFRRAFTLMQDAPPCAS
jgi:hypothetical protein